ncbi:MAG TPA: hypothetical protein VIK53_17145 [Verrucomicrobiae bacterium]
MNLETTNRASGAAVGFVLAIILFVALAVVVKSSVYVPAVDADRSTERSKDLAEIRAAEEKSLDTLGWADQARGFVRLPIDDAMKLAAQAWQNPAAARADLNARAEKAAAPAPVVAPKPNAFE